MVNNITSNPMTLADLYHSYQKLLVVALETGLDGAAGKFQMRGESVTILTDDLDKVCAYIVRNRLPAVRKGETNQREYFRMLVSQSTK